MAINVQKLVPSSFSSQQVSQEKLIEVKRSVIDVEKLMTGIIAFEKKQQDTQRQAREEKRYQRREDQLEKKEIKKQFKLNLPSLPRMGFFDWIKNFVTNTLLGFFAVRLLKHLPKLVGFVSLAASAGEGILNFAGGLLNGVATFVEWGYKAYDATRGFLKQIGGDKTVGLFDKFLDGLDTFLLLSLGASTLKVGRGLLGKGTKALLAGVIRAGAGVGSRLFGGALDKVRLSRTLEIGQLKRVIETQADRIKALNAARRSVAPVRQGTAAYVKKRTISITRETIPEVARVGGERGREILAEAQSAAARRSKGSALALYDPAVRLGVTSFDDAILDSIEKNPSLSSVEKNRLKAERFEQIQRRKVAADLEFVKKSNIDIDPKLRADAELDAALDQLVGGSTPKAPRGPDPTRPGLRTDNLFDAIKNTPSRKRSFLIGAKKFLKGARLPIIGGLIDFGLSWMLGEPVGRAAFKAIGATLFGAVGGLMGGGIASIFTGALAAAGGDYLGGLLYDLLFENKQTKNTKTKDYFYAYSSGGAVGRGPQKRIKKRREYLSQPSQDPIEPGKDVGEKKFEEMFPRGASGFFGIGSKKDAYGYLQAGYNLLSKASLFGPLFGIAIKSLLGDKPNSGDYRSASVGLSNWMTSTFGNVAMQGYANGGLVGGGMFLDSRQIQRTVESSLEERVTREVDDAINELRRRLGIEDKKEKENEKGKGRGTATGRSNYNERGSFSGTGGEMIRSEEATKLAGDLGRFIESKLVSAAQAGGGYTDGDYLRITEHPDYGGSFTRDYKSWHNVDRAIDIGAFPHEQQKILDVIEEFNQMRGVTPVELLHAGNDPTGGHNDHVHVAYFKGGSTGKGGVIRVHEDEWVVDKDSKKLYGNAFLHLINSTENESQRKQNSLRLMSILQSYAGYESGFEQTVTVPVPAPQMIPVPVPMSSNEPIMMPSGGGSSGRASDILESIG